jgi:hypothetical protein
VDLLIPEKPTAAAAISWGIWSGRKTVKNRLPAIVEAGGICN